MRNYEPLGKHLQLVDTRNSDSITDEVLGINIDKYFMPSVANVIGTDLSKYKLISKGLFACNPMHVGRDERLPIALYSEDHPALVSPAYFMFKIADETVINSEYLMMWFRRPEFDRQCWLRTDGSVRGGITWDDICRLEVPVISYEEQIHIVESYKVITDRIELKRRINDNLTAQMVTFAKLMFPLSPQAADNGTVSDLCEAIYSGGTPTTTEADYWNGPYPWLSSGETSNDYIIATEKTITEEGIKESSTRLASKGSIVIASAGQGLTRGQTSLLLIDTYVNQSVIVLRPKEGCGEFLFSNLKGRYDEMRNISDLDSIRGSLTTKTISALPVCISDNKAIKDFSARCIPIIDTIHKNELEIRALKSLAENITCSISSH